MFASRKTDLLILCMEVRVDKILTRELSGNNAFINGRARQAAGLTRKALGIHAAYPGILHDQPLVMVSTVEAKEN